MAEYTLHCDYVSGNCYKVALMLALSGADWKPVFIDFLGGATRTDGYRGAMNEMGEIPVLEHQGRKLTQSGVILTYLADRLGKFGGKTEDEKLEVLRWILFDNHKFTSYFATLRFLVGIKKMGESPVTDFLRGRAMAAWGIADQHLATRAFLLGAAPTIADFSLAGYVYYPEETGLDRSKFPNIEAWSKRIAALPGWKPPSELMPAKAA